MHALSQDTAGGNTDISYLRSVNVKEIAKIRQLVGAGLEYRLSDYKARASQYHSTPTLRLPNSLLNPHVFRDCILFDYCFQQNIEIIQ